MHIVVAHVVESVVVENVVVVILVGWFENTPFVVHILIIIVVPFYTKVDDAPRVASSIPKTIQI
tara:strand:- start:162 stop:353 length:192 start_codon:yes stop_codon:yes gene_type:complete